MIFKIGKYLQWNTCSKRSTVLRFSSTNILPENKFQIMVDI